MNWFVQSVIRWCERKKIKELQTAMKDPHTIVSTIPIHEKMLVVFNDNTTPNDVQNCIADFNNWDKSGFFYTWKSVIYKIIIFQSDGKSFEFTFHNEMKK